MFFLKNTKLVASGKITWFWSTLKKVPRINYDVTKRYRVLKFFKLMEKNTQLKLMGCLFSNWLLRFLNLFYQEGLSLAFWNGFFKILKFRSILVICQRFAKLICLSQNRHRVSYDLTAWNGLFRICLYINFWLTKKGLLRFFVFTN